MVENQWVDHVRAGMEGGRNKGEEEMYAHLILEWNRGWWRWEALLSLTWWVSFWSPVLGSSVELSCPDSCRVVDLEGERREMGKEVGCLCSLTSPFPCVDGRSHMLRFHVKRLAQLWVFTGRSLNRPLCEWEFYIKKTSSPGPPSPPYSHIHTHTHTTCTHACP